MDSHDEHHVVKKMVNPVWCNFKRCFGGGLKPWQSSKVARLFTGPHSLAEKDDVLKDYQSWVRERLLAAAKRQIEKVKKLIDERKIL